MTVLTPDRAKLFRILSENAIKDHERYNIGTYKEKQLHIMMKKYFESDDNYHEVPVNGYVADICRDGSIIEIETNGFSGLKPKLGAYLDEYKVNLVMPLCTRKYISWIDPNDASIGSRHISPKHENVYTMLFELCRILPYITHPNLTVTAVMLEVEEYRLLDGWSADKKKGSHRYERIPTDIIDTVSLHDNADYRALIPSSLGEEYTAADFRKSVKASRGTEYGMLRVLKERGIIEECGKKGNAKIYKTGSLS